ncbi:hypothetical protein BC834DRAFT_526053 [Gloeopeniophorella convolvens]|nr:hypothetical protein BC834DRAFT_526053 [Gloeopeniophorella convolvens]
MRFRVTTTSDHTEREYTCAPSLFLNHVYPDTYSLSVSHVALMFCKFSSGGFLALAGPTRSDHFGMLGCSTWACVAFKTLLHWPGGMGDRNKHPSPVPSAMSTTIFPSDILSDDTIGLHDDVSTKSSSVGWETRTWHPPDGPSEDKNSTDDHFIRYANHCSTHQPSPDTSAPYPPLHTVHACHRQRCIETRSPV